MIKPVALFFLLCGGTLHTFEQLPHKNTSNEHTFALIKPDAVAAHYSGAIITLIERNGFTIAQMEKRLLTKDEAAEFYVEHKDKYFFKNLVEYITSGPIIALDLQKENAQAEWRAFMGPTDPATAGVGTLRRMFGTSRQCNAVHGSDSLPSATREIKFFFPSSSQPNTPPANLRESQEL